MKTFPVPVPHHRLTFDKLAESFCKIKLSTTQSDYFECNTRFTATREQYQPTNARTLLQMNTITILILQVREKGQIYYKIIRILFGRSRKQNMQICSINETQ